ncbi:hypothetical protein [Streptomyces sp. NPDC047000]|uniref:hypothetical protein n=1 Tax=Streptomyces sp. NPDC047000 TaxID=3155474 RepID=UPI0033DB7C2C
MDPISVGLLVAMATGAGGEAGRSLWETLTGLVRRRPERQPLPVVRPAGEDGLAGEDEPADEDGLAGEDELAALNESPHDMLRARALSESLTRRARQDPAFREALERWSRQAQGLHSGEGQVTNIIGGGSQQGPVLQGRDFSGITFNGPAEEGRAPERGPGPS